MTSFTDNACLPRSQTFSQQTSSVLTQISPQQRSPGAHSNSSPLRFEHVTDASLHSVDVLTGYQALLGPLGLQHLLPGAKHAFPQHPPPAPWHGKLSPLTFSQQTSCSPTQAPPQHLSPPAHWK